MKQNHLYSHAFDLPYPATPNLPLSNPTPCLAPPPTPAHREHERGSSPNFGRFGFLEYKFRHPEYRSRHPKSKSRDPKHISSFIKIRYVSDTYSYISVYFHIIFQFLVIRVDALCMICKFCHKHPYVLPDLRGLCCTHAYIVCLVRTHNLCHWNGNCLFTE